MKMPDKDPSAELDYVFNWGGTPAWLATGETIASAVVTADPGVTVAPSGKATATTATTVTVWLGGGAVGTTYAVACRITTTAGRVDERTMRVTVRNR